MILCFSLSLSAYSSETCLINKLKEPMSITRDVRPKVLLWKHLAHHNIKVSEVTMRFLLFFLLTLPVYASFEGSYSGAGRAVFASGRVYECSEIFMRMETDLENFRLREGGYICGMLQASFDAYRLTIKDGSLWHKDQLLGQISDQEMNYEIFDPLDGSTYRLRLRKKSPQELVYFEEWHDGEEIALTVKGLLLAQ